MKDCSPENFDCKRLLFAALLVAALVLPQAVIAESVSVSGKEEKESRIHITSDRLISESKENTAEFIGNVRATQDNTEILCDRLKIHYKQGTGKEESVNGGDSIQKIIADGNVTIKMDDKVAVTDNAVFMKETDVLVLTGPNSKITSENNFVSGDKITLYRSEDRMIVDGSSEGQVEAVLYTKEKGID